MDTTSLTTAAAAAATASHVPEAATSPSSSSPSSPSPTVAPLVSPNIGRPKRLHVNAFLFGKSALTLLAVFVLLVGIAAQRVEKRSLGIVLRWKCDWKCLGCTVLQLWAGLLTASLTFVDLMLEFLLVKLGQVVFKVELLKYLLLRRWCEHARLGLSAPRHTGRGRGTRTSGSTLLLLLLLLLLILLSAASRATLSGAGGFGVVCGLGLLLLLLLPPALTAASSLPTTTASLCGCWCLLDRCSLLWRGADAWRLLAWRVPIERVRRLWVAGHAWRGRPTIAWHRSHARRQALLNNGGIYRRGGWCWRWRRGCIQHVEVLDVRTTENDVLVNFGRCGDLGTLLASVLGSK
mmetsp:Transcript_17892/g.42596  ORF Transcript_17892/g.42596 Transcript_17892/m.42596 type:complete len:349 (-) Transcript_17892:143-1189(-)